MNKKLGVAVLLQTRPMTYLIALSAAFLWLPSATAADIDVECYLCNTLDLAASKSRKGPACYDPVQGGVGTQKCKNGCYWHKLTAKSMGKLDQMHTQLIRACNFNNVQMGCTTDIAVGQKAWNETASIEGTVTEAEVCACNEDRCNGKAYMAIPQTKPETKSLAS